MTSREEPVCLKRHTGNFAHLRRFGCRTDWVFRRAGRKEPFAHKQEKENAKWEHCDCEMNEVQKK